MVYKGVKLGDSYLFSDNYYKLAALGDSSVVLINWNTSVAFTNPIPVNDINDITETEWFKISKGAVFTHGDKLDVQFNTPYDRMTKVKLLSFVEVVVVAVNNQLNMKTVLKKWKVDNVNESDYVDSGLNFK